MRSKQYQLDPPMVLSALDPCEGVTGALTVPLMEHQKQGVRWMTAMEKSHHRGGILADDIGLGKTVQDLALIVTHPAQHVNRHATLVVTPASLIQQWQHEIEQFLRSSPHRQRVYVYYGDRRGKAIPVLNGYDIVLTTFGTITAELRRTGPRQHARNLAGPHRSSPLFGPASGWHRVILDEAQFIKIDQSQTAAACCALDATYRWCLSGTPVMNNLRELYSLLKFLRVQPYASRQSFATAFQQPLQTRGSPQRAAATARLRRLMDTIMLRRTKTSTIQGQPILQLPVKTTEIVYVTFTEPERELYTALEYHTRLQFNHYLSGGNPSRNVSHMLGLLQRLRQACCHPFLDNEKENGREFDCPICYDTVDNHVIFFPCGHSVCVKCFARIFPQVPTARPRVEGNPPMCCPSCRVVIDPSKATDHKAFAKQHYPTPPGDVGTETLSTVLENLRGRVEDDRDDGQDLMLGIPAGAEHAYPPVQFHINPTPTIHAPKQSFARLRQRALTSPAAKQKALEIVRDIVARGEPSRERKKVVIFSQFTSMLDLIEIPLARHGWAFRRYDGTMKPADRHAATVHFATNPNCLILLVSMKASNSGLNLTAASQVIILDPFWNPYVEDQAIGRVHRIGQRRPVHVHRILVSNTVEDRILDFQDRKRQLIEGIVDHRTHGEPSRLESTDFAYLFINGQTQPGPKKSQVDGLKAGTLKRRSVPAPIKQTKQAWRWYREQQCDRNCQKDTLAPRHGPPRSSFAMQLSAF
ncbi:SNF2 family N-terminal domain-containing protein [Aspergillus flavus]|uniref:SNF2 family N-terminal domain-containing protein n=2 Tax=Aspergillus flavus TaxID=5059 RepID=A0A5N6GDE3_ASPFL|nr:SNF2 family N-terminal domain-containing protein [Aspergillus flavus]